MRKTLVFAALSCCALAVPVGANELIVNGGFETGTYAGWNTFVFAGSSGNIQVNPNGANAPISGLGVNANPGGGNWVSLTDQSGPGAYSLVQAFTVPIGATQVVVSFDQVVTDWSGAGPIIDPAGLDFTGNANQHSRVDILVGGAAPFSTAAADIVANLYLGVDPGQPAGWTSYSFNLTGLLLPGITYYFRAGEVDNQLFENQGIDNVSVEASVPEPASWAMMIAGFAGIGLAMRRHRGFALRLA